MGRSPVGHFRMEHRAEAAPVRGGELDVGDAQDRQRLQRSRIGLACDALQEMLPERAVSVLRDRAVEVGDGCEVAFGRGAASCALLSASLHSSLLQLTSSTLMFTVSTCAP